MTKTPALLLLILLLTFAMGCEDKMRGQALQAQAELEATIAADEQQAEPELVVLDAAGLTELRKETADAGQVLVIDIWATWCGSCLQMFPQLHKAMKERGEDVRIVSLCWDENTTGGKDFVGEANRFIKRQDAFEDAYLAIGGEAKEALPAALGGTWSDGVLPAVFVYDTKGELVHEMLETEGKVEDWVAGIAAAADNAADN